MAKTATKRAKANKKKPAQVDLSKKKLTPKQMAFCVWYCSDDVKYNGREAAKLAGYRGSATTLSTIASENLTKPNVAAEIEKRKAQALSGAGVTIESTLNKILTVYEKAFTAGKYSVSLRAAELLGRHLKMFTDRIEHVEDLEEMTLPQLQALLREIVKDGNVNISELLEGNGSGDSGRVSAQPDKTTH